MLSRSIQRLSVTLLATTTSLACTPSNPQETPQLPPAPTTAAPSLSPFTQELTEEQQAALVAVKDFCRALVEVQSDPEAEITQVTTRFENTRLAINEGDIIMNDRKRGVVMTGDYIYHFHSVGDLVETGEIRSIEVRLCLDNREVDFVDQEGNSFVRPDRTGFVNVTMDMVDTSFGWLINDYQFEEAKQC